MLLSILVSGEWKTYTEKYPFFSCLFQSTMKRRHSEAFGGMLTIYIPEYTPNSVASNTSPMEDDAGDPSINPSSNGFMEVDGQKGEAHQWADNPVCTTVSTFVEGKTPNLYGLFCVP